MESIKITLFVCIFYFCVDYSDSQTNEKILCGKTFSRVIPSTKAPRSPISAAPSRIGKIVGGKDSRSGDMPWIVSIQKVDLERKKNSPFCGGSIITQNWVLTAAHCFKNKIENLDIYKIKSGSLISDADSGDGTYHSIKRVIRHEDFTTESYRGDIALIEVDPPFTFSKGHKFGRNSIWPICLPYFYDSFEGTATIAGWGLNISDSYTPTSKLQAADINIFECKKDVKNCSCLAYPLFSAPHMLCAGYEQGGIDACQGDSGGPLMSVLENGNGQNTVVQIGIVSFGEGCAEANKPGVYTDLTAYIRWVSDNISPDEFQQCCESNKHENDEKRN